MIVEPIGAGGMGEVYRARDERLAREVAIKILPQRLSNNPAALARFQREARAVAAISHHNILAIFDVGETDGVSCIVMELLHGETLRRRLRGGPLAVDLAVDFARHIAAGLAAAHDKGITHRDLKPENVIVTDAGQLKLLDFGLAKVEGQKSDAELETADLADIGPSVPGMVLGTVGYMSPEQVSGGRADHRSDIFAFGVLFYEMLAGVSPFHRASSIETLHAVLKDGTPDIGAIADGVTDGLSRLVRRCLAKDPDQRFQSAREVTAALETAVVVGPLAPRSSASAHPPPDGRSSVPSLAVLPFADMTPDGTHKYFCEGMAEDLISALGKVAGLRVVARSSAFQFTDRGVDLRRVGDVLNVDSILEGSLRSAGTQLRIVVPGRRPRGLSALVGTVRRPDGECLRGAGRDLEAGRRGPPWHTECGSPVRSGATTDRRS